MVAASYIPDAGHVIKLDLDPRTGHEQGGWRPAIVLSPRSYNAKTGLAVVVPVTNQVKGYPFEVTLPAQMNTSGVVLADAIRNLDWQARRAKYIETAMPDVMSGVRQRLTALLGFNRG